MNGLQDISMQDHGKLVDSINRRVDSIYKQLCEYEECINPNALEECGDSQTKIMDLLDTVETIQEAAQFIRPYNLELRSQQQALKEQVKCLELSLDLLKLEREMPESSNVMLN